MHDRARGIIQKLRAMAGLVAKSATVDPYAIDYLEGGRGEPVLLAHGFGADKDMWAQFAQYLTKRRRHSIIGNSSLNRTGQWRSQLHLPIMHHVWYVIIKKRKR